jgi:monovalent cation:proton antiporter-2 (CPA2) family protein
MAGAGDVPYLWQVIAFLITVVVIVPLFKRWKISPILGYLAVGSAIGPYALAWVPNVDAVRHLAEFGVVFLLFSLGLELSFGRLKNFSRLIFGLGGLQVLVTSCAIAAVALLWGNSAEVALILGLCLSLSSTAMVVPLLQERGELSSVPGHSSFAVLLFQDLAVVPILILVGLLGVGNIESLGGSLLLALAKAVLAIGLIVVIGRFVLRFLFVKAMASRSVDVFIAVMLLAVLATSLATEMAGLSLALGAFLAGLLIAETEFRHQVESEIEPFKGLLLGLFFMGVGMNLDLSLAFHQGLWVLAATLGLMLIKAVIASLLARLMGLSWSAAISTGVLLSQAGEFAFVVLGQATLSFGLMPVALGQFMVVVAGLSMLATPLAVSVGFRVAAWIAARQPCELSTLPQQHATDHVVIAGFGRVGRAVANVLQRESIPYVAIDATSEAVRQARMRQENVILGDARKPELLKKAQLEGAKAVVITMDDPAAAKQTLQAIKHLWPLLPVFIRSRDALHSGELLALGASSVVPETLEVSLQLASSALQATGLSREEANCCLDSLRAQGLDVWQRIEKC